MDRHTIRKTYDAMINRCFNGKDPNYHKYGGAGVSVCEEWTNSYELFYEWSINNGWSPDLELDKDIKGTGKLYSPECCLWTTHAENMRHLASAPKYEYNGTLSSRSQISFLTGIPKSTLIIRQNAGMTMQEAIAEGLPKATSGNTKFHTYKGETMSLRAWCKKLNLIYSLIRFRVNDKGMSLEDAIQDKVFYDRKDKKYTDIIVSKGEETFGPFSCISEIIYKLGGEKTGWRDLILKELKTHSSYSLVSVSIKKN